MSKFNFATIAALALLWAIALPVTAQTPYSQYGYGTLDDNASGAQRAMGGTGIGMRSNQQINVMNPASYTAIDSLTFMFDLSADFRANWYNENGNKAEGIGGGLNYITMQFPLSKNVAGCVGLTPVSHVEYTYGDSIPNGSFTRVGEGGISQVFLGLAYEPWEWVSLGVNFGYMFGNIQNLVQVAPDGSSTGYYYNILKVSDFRFQAGLQFMHEFNKKHNFTLGLTYTLGKPTLGEVMPYSTYSDTISFPMKEYYSMPHCFGAGLSYTFDKRLTIAADARYDLWEDAKFYNANTDSYEPMNNRMRLSAGVEFRPKLVSSSYFDYIHYRVGGFFNRSYIKVRGSEAQGLANVDYNNVREFGVSLGFGFPLRSNKSLLNVTFEYSHRNCVPQRLLSEDHLSIVLSMTFNEMWFWQRKFE